MREKLSIWRVQLFPRLRATRALEVLKRLRRLVPPRVVAATLRTWFNGWCTARRFQGRDSCLFGCRLGEDSVHHYLRCGRLQDFGTARLRLPSEERPEARTLAALMLQPGSSMNDEMLTRRALLVAAAYRLHCAHRRGRPFSDVEGLHRALEQAVKPHPSLDGKEIPVCRGADLLPARVPQHPTWWAHK